MQTQILVQSFINGLLLGGLYAIIGLGMSLIFGIMGMTNIAHGDFMILGTFFCMVLALQFSGNVLLALLITMAIMGVFGLIIQSFVVNRVIDKGSEPALLVTFGLSIFIRNILFLIFGADARVISVPALKTNIVNTRWFSIAGDYALNFVVAIIVVLAVHFIIRKTPISFV